MAYYDVAQLSQDTDFVYRTTACYAIEHESDPETYTEDAAAWVYRHAWTMAAQPGFGDAYASALVSGNPEPGKDPSVITDPQILSAVQSILAEEAPPAP